MAEHNERRRAQRVDASLNLNVRLSGDDGAVATASLETINISTSGIYFRSDHFIEPMTKLAMDIEVTVPAERDGGTDLATVSCEGLVVRSSPEVEVAGTEDYEIAVFFTHVADDGLANLERHIGLLLSDAD